MSEDGDAILKRLGEVQLRLDEVKIVLDSKRGDGCDQCRFVVFSLLQDVLQHQAEIAKRVTHLETAFVRTPEAIDTEGHRLFHVSVMDSRRGWAATWNSIKGWAIRGLLGAAALGVLTLILDWLRRGGK